MKKGTKHSNKTIKLLSKTHKGKPTWNAGTGQKKVYVCRICKKEFSDYLCNKRKVCSRKCRMKYMSLVMKGHEVSQTTRDKIGKSQKSIKRGKIKDASNYGHTAWNKGKEWLEMRGENNPRYIRDRTQLKISEKKHLDSRYIDWMLGIKKRDKWKCRLLNKKCKGRLEAHHIFNWIEYPLQRYDINNGITLCHAHHPRGRAKEKRLAKKFIELVSVSSEYFEDKQIVDEGGKHTA